LTPAAIEKQVHIHKNCVFVICSFSSDDDSEPILGQWFEETISPSKEKAAPPPPPPPPPLESSPRVKSPNKQASGEKGNILASRKDPELVRLVSEVLWERLLEYSEWLICEAYGVGAKAFISWIPQSLALSLQDFK
jgi:hypothetical protein